MSALQVVGFRTTPTKPYLFMNTCVSTGRKGSMTRNEELNSLQHNLPFFAETSPQRGVVSVSEPLLF